MRYITPMTVGNSESSHRTAEKVRPVAEPYSIFRKEVHKPIE